MTFRFGERFFNVMPRPCKNCLKGLILQVKNGIIIKISLWGRVNELTSVRFLLIALAVFFIVSVADKHKSLLRRGGNTLAAVFLLSLNVVAEMKQISPLAPQLQNLSADKLSFMVRDWLAAFGFSQSMMITAQMYLISLITVFALFCKDNAFVPFSSVGGVFSVPLDIKDNDVRPVSLTSVRGSLLACVKMLN